MSQDTFWERRQWRIFRKIVRAFLCRFEFDRMIAVIVEEQRYVYYEDNYFNRRGQFEDAIEKVLKI